MVVAFSSPFLGTFFQWQRRTCNFRWQIVFVPFLGDFLSIRNYNNYYRTYVFVPFLGDFLSIYNDRHALWKREQFSSPFLGTFFQSKFFVSSISSFEGVFVPFLGDFLSMIAPSLNAPGFIREFSSPFLGTFFQLPSRISRIALK